MSQTAAVRIRVTDTARRPLGKAKVNLIQAGAKKRGVALTYDERTGSYVGSVEPGEYVVEAALRGLRGESRTVTVQPAGTAEVVVLGEEGLPAYWLGGVRVPFDPPRGLVAVTLDGTARRRGEDVDARVAGVAADLGLEPVEVPEPVLANNVRVFATDPDRVDEVVARLNDAEGIRRAGPVLHLDKDSVTYLTDEVVVRFQDQVEAETVSGIAREFGLRVLRSIPYAGNAFVLKAPAVTFELLDVLDRLVSLDEVQYAEPNLVVTVVDDFTPNDDRYDDQPHHAIIGSEGAWDVTLGSNAITIAVMDSGCEIAHPDFQNPMGAGWTKVVNAFDFADYDSDPASGTHGTKSAGIAAAVTNNTTGVAGLAGGCRLMPLRRPDGGVLTEFADAYIWAAGFDPGSTTPGFPAVIAANPADVISNSFGRTEAMLPAIMKDTFDYLTTYGRGGRGCVVVFSTGNDGLDFTTYRQWAAYERTIAVAASRISPPDAAEVKVTSSNFGDKVDLCAPGGGEFDPPETRTLSTTAGGGYSTFGQTSCACPQVSGTVALMLSANPALTWTQVRELLRDTAVRIDNANADPTGQYVDNDGDGVAEYSQWYGYGRLNAAAAVSGAATYVAGYDVVVRENLADTGAVASAGAFWNSPDIWVRQTAPAMDAGALPASYGTAGPHEPADFGQDNWVYVRLRNNQAGASLPFYVRVYLAHFAGTEFVYPADFVPSNGPGSTPAPPLQPGTYLLGEVAHAPLAGMTESIVNVTWPSALVPDQYVDVDGTPVAWHPCLLVEISPHDGPNASGNHVWDDNNLAQKNISIDYTDDDDDKGAFGAFMVLGNALNPDRELELVVDRGRLPRDVELYVRFVDERVAKQVRARLSGDTNGHDGGDGLRVKLLDESRIELATPGERLRLRVPPGTLLESVLPEVRLVKPAGRPSWDGDRLRLPYTRRVRIPVPVQPGDLVGIVVGGRAARTSRAGTYHVVVGQHSPGGDLTGAAGVEVRIGKRKQ
ncbi:MAG TPA: S8 family serine peptidase [Frankiaceae bacterium]|nr:S8 family serine peptidase [Frankiaceae bacterium]